MQQVQDRDNLDSIHYTFDVLLRSSPQRFLPVHEHNNLILCHRIALLNFLTKPAKDLLN